MSTLSYYPCPTGIMFNLITFGFLYAAVAAERASSVET